MDLHVFPILNPPSTSSPSHHSGSSQCTSPEHPVSCIEPGLAICFTYDNIHFSMLFSQIIPSSPSPTEFKRLFFTSVSLSLSPSPTEFKRLFFTSVSLSLSHIYCHCYHLSKFHIYVLEYCICVFLSDFTLYNRLQFHPAH